MRELIRNPFHESEFGLEAGTGHHPSDLPGIEENGQLFQHLASGPGQGWR
ncbi:MAG: hypothetical protein WDO74_04150 [Pseudomonadota bacterium]